MTIIPGINLCPPPFWDASLFLEQGGYIDGRLCQAVGEMKCCLPCPMNEWMYPDYFTTLTAAANWVACVSVICCVFLLLSWAFLPVEKTSRHYLSICLTIGVMLMSLGFVIPLAAQPNQCYNKITPHSMKTSKVCGASGSFLLLGGWAGVMWAFLRSVSLHLQICWQVLVGKNFMIFAQAVGWGVPIMGLILALVFSGLSFRFGATCHINHSNSLADFWIPLLLFAGLTVIITFATFGYCIKVYLAALSDHGGSSEGSNLPTYSNNSLRPISPGQAYRRVRRVISLQWRGIAIVLIIIADVVFFSVIFVFQDNVVEQVTHDPEKAKEWVKCLIRNSGHKNKCLYETTGLVVNLATVTAVLLLLALNGVWVLFLMGRWTMATGWIELVQKLFPKKSEFVSVDARSETTAMDRPTYEMLSRDSASVVLSPLTPAKSPEAGRQTPDFFGQAARYHAPARSFSNPRPPLVRSWDSSEISFTHFGKEKEPSEAER